ncbi:MAG: glycerol-3-phosphate cytidylyltransferase [Nautiliaceae bacterium]
MKRVLTYGTFDMFHIGHLNLLKRAKELGDYLIVGVSTDGFNQIKGKKTLIPFNERKDIVESIKYVDLVIPENNWEQKIDDIKKYKVDVFVMGDDWRGKFDFLKDYCEVIYLPRTEGISTTKLKENLKSFYNIDIEGLKKAMETIEAILKAME